jgi:prepilin-type N-terminal cleavage/methylation domain-containing protein
VNARLLLARERGFTLLELLVAIAIFAVIGAMALTGYVQLQTERLLAATLSVRGSSGPQILTQGSRADGAAADPPAIGDGRLPALMAGTTVTPRSHARRLGNTAGLPRPTLQRRVSRRQDGLWRDACRYDGTLSVGHQSRNC